LPNGTDDDGIGGGGPVQAATATTAITAKARLRTLLRTVRAYCSSTGSRDGLRCKKNEREYFEPIV
jgi:hypothetical protein